MFGLKKAIYMSIFPTFQQQCTHDGDQAMQHSFHRAQTFMSNAVLSAVCIQCFVFIPPDTVRQHIWGTVLCRPLHRYIPHCLTHFVDLLRFGRFGNSSQIFVLLKWESRLPS